MPIKWKWFILIFWATNPLWNILLRSICLISINSVYPWMVRTICIPEGYIICCRKKLIACMSTMLVNCMQHRTDSVLYYDLATMFLALLFQCLQYCMNCNSNNTIDKKTVLAWTQNATKYKIIPSFQAWFLL